MVEVPSFLQIGWLNAIREWQEEFVGNMSSREFVETITRDLLGSCVFVFTPRGEV
jgi:(p)ppGpp synthase/HD superfamily hydrolase